MDKAVLISIRPNYCELIANGKKTVEVRKTRPKIDTPFKCYIYCTKDKHGWFDLFRKKRLDGKVIGEFVCDKIENFKEFEYSVDTLHRHIKLNACINYAEIRKYLGVEKCGYGWHISDLVIYGTPKELSEFEKLCMYDCKNCEYWNPGSLIDYEPSGCEWKDRYITRPPQSWCYVEELEQGNDELQ